MKNKRIFGYFELVFDLFYLLIALVFGLIMINKNMDTPQFLAGVMALVLVFGDAFHLLPRMGTIVAKNKGRFQKALGAGKFVTSITMTVFYVLLWHIGLLLFQPENSFVFTLCIYILAGVRILLCLFPQNMWLSENPSVKWGMIRNIPFVIQGALVAILYFLYQNNVAALHWVWLAIVLSFLFYVPVVLWVHKKPALGMLMLPKTCMYIWLLWQFFSMT